MREKELRALPVLMATEELVMTARADHGEQKFSRPSWDGSYRYQVTGHRYFVYLRAVLSGTILRVYLYQREKLCNWILTPDYVIFLDIEKEDFTTLETKTGKFREAMIASLCAYPRGAGSFASRADRELIHMYMDWQEDPACAIYQWQLNIRKEQLERRHKKETDAIDAVMDKVPDEPADFRKWAEDEGYLHERYLFYTYSRKPKKGYCSYCGKEVDLLEKPRLNGNGICPACKSRVIYKTWKSQKVILDEQYFALLQQLTDKSGYVMRLFRSKKRYRQEEFFHPEFFVYESERVILDTHLGSREVYSMDFYKNTSVMRWCNGAKGELWHDYHYLVLYHRNLCQLRKGIEPLKYVPIEKIFQRFRGKALPVYSLMQACVTRPAWEYLIKFGLINLAVQLCGYSHLTTLDYNQKKPWDMLRIRKEDFTLACKRDYGDRMIRIMQHERTYGFCFQEQEREWFCQFIGVHDILRYMRYATPHKFVRYLKEEMDAEKNRHAAQDYEDYIRDLESLGQELHEANLFPQNFQQAHEEAARQVTEMQNKRKAAETKQKNRKMAKMTAGWQELYGFEKDGYQILFPHNREELQAEGKLQHHCVGTYFDRVVDGTCVIAFVRKAEEPEVPLCTVEWRGEKLIQHRMKYNQAPPPEIKDFIGKWEQQVKKNYAKLHKAEVVAVAAG